ncbi:MAG TPA: hypothetical protein VGE77_09660 [Nocardioides sp.]
MTNYWLGLGAAAVTLPIAYIMFEAFAPAVILAVGIGVIAALFFGAAKSGA